jgi:ribosome-associated protein YbcJ (S4-like RNA binding protein)
MSDEKPPEQAADPYITLAQLCKMLKLVDSGGQAKHFVRAGGILVNGEEEKRPGRKLRKGDKVKVKGEEYEVGV